MSSCACRCHGPFYLFVFFSPPTRFIDSVLVLIRLGTGVYVTTADADVWSAWRVGWGVG
ncbi:hypothetical protein AG1IA_07557 [Rhizoctonia solani AG-1 IA]|uniref:Uncharacterized protein n=1 Tax=Thanatephorus cucumeris (strain AG1-IA) TaxID=983506 RepID=L8WNS6_THACA|nr:hypothetical protein AG1IA_07557 [Rhizoctonia solani AG-1 IA]